MFRLCSKSETRAKILLNFGIKFIQSGVDFNEESIKTAVPKSFAYEAVKGKLTAAEEKFGLDIPILVADTVVEAGGEILRKAKSKENAREILLKQSGGKISIITAAALKKKGLLFWDISATEYFFSEFEQNDLEEYIKSGLWQGKAGACMVEGFCKKYIKEVVGLESTAMGLQIEKIAPWIGLNVLR